MAGVELAQVHRLVAGTGHGDAKIPPPRQSEGGAVEREAELLRTSPARKGVLRSGNVRDVGYVRDVGHVAERHRPTSPQRFGLPRPWGNASRGGRAERKR